MRILLDVDGPLAAWMPAVLDLIKQATGRELTQADVGDWLNLRKLGLSKTELALVETSLASRGWTEELAVEEGARDGVAALRALGAQITYVTAPWTSSETWAWERRRWLQKNGFYGVSPHDQLVITASKHVVRGHMLVDDKLENLLGWSKLNEGRPAVLWTTPWNTRQDYKQRVSSWEQLLEVARQCQKTLT